MKKAILFAALVYLSNVLNAQAPGWEWARNNTGNSYMGTNAPKGIVTDATGNVYMYGIFGDTSIVFDGTTLVNVQPVNTDIFLVKYDSLGNLLWARSIGGDRQDLAGGICIDATGNIIITGYFYSHTINIGGNILANLDTSTIFADIFIAKYDPSGHVTWARRSGGDFGDDVEAITVDTHGNIIVAGGFSGDSIVLGGLTITNPLPPNYRFFIAKLDTSGNGIWANTAGGPLITFANGVSADTVGNVYVTGSFSDTTLTFGTTVLTNFDRVGSVNGSSVFVVKYDSSGNVVWAKGSRGSYNDAATAIATDTRGNVYVTGDFESDTISFDGISLPLQNSTHSYNMFIVKYDSTGNVIRASGAGCNFFTVPQGISIDTSGNVYVTGLCGCDIFTIANISLQNSAHIGTNDAFVIKYDTAGNGVWAKMVGGHNNDAGACVAADTRGNVFVAGNFSSATMAFGADTLQDTGPGYSVFIAKIGYDQLKGIDVNSISENDIIIYPNPTTGTIYFKGIRSGARVDVYNVLGEMIYSNTFGKSPSGNLGVGDNYSINLSGNSKGIYFYRVVNNTGTIGLGKIILD